MFFGSLSQERLHTAQERKRIREKIIDSVNYGLWAVALLVSLTSEPAMAAEPMPGDVTYGYVTPYNDQPREQTIQNRLRWDQIDEECAKNAHVALKKDHVGEYVWLQEENGTVHGPLCVFDLLAGHHYDDVSANYIGDISRKLWEQFKSHKDVKLFYKNPIQSSNSTQSINARNDSLRSAEHPNMRTVKDEAFENNIIEAKCTLEEDPESGQIELVCND